MLTTWLIAGVMACGQADAADKEKPADKAAAAESADADLKARVRKLVRELDARQKARRDEAEQQLMQLGPAALDLLPETTARTPAEVALRLDRIRSQFEHSTGRKLRESLHRHAQRQGAAAVQGAGGDY